LEARLWHIQGLFSQYPWTVIILTKLPQVIYPQSITKIEDNHSQATLLKCINLANPPTNVRKIKMISNANLPNGTQHLFTKVMGPITCKTTGALEPWETPDDDDELIEI
jgi:hypothetical protein